MIFITTAPDEPSYTLNCCYFSKDKYWHFTSMSITVLETRDHIFSLLTFMVICYCTELSNSFQGSQSVPLVINALSHILSFSTLPGSQSFSVFSWSGDNVAFYQMTQICAHILESNAKLLFKHWKSNKICPTSVSSLR